MCGLCGAPLQAGSAEEVPVITEDGVMYVDRECARLAAETMPTWAVLMDA